MPDSTESAKVLVVTGASGGLGLEITRAAKARGYTVAALVRRATTELEELSKGPDGITIYFADVTDHTACSDAVTDMVEKFGRIDVLVNNAGYGVSGAFEETTTEEARAIFEVNFHGAVHLTRSVLPVMRGQGAGAIVQISSIGAVSPFSALGFYNASKSALEAVTEALAQEVGAFGIKCMLIEPGSLRTGWHGSNLRRTKPLSVYDEVLSERRKALSGGPESLHGRQPGSPQSAAEAIMDAIALPEPPLRTLLGEDAVRIASRVFKERTEALSRQLDQGNYIISME